jgi:hypothetical protein
MQFGFEVLDKKSGTTDVTSVRTLAELFMKLLTELLEMIL